MKTRGTYEEELRREVEPVCRRSWALRWLVPRAVIGAAFGLAAAQWGAAVDARRSAAVERASQGPPVQGRGELWLRCPTSGTWYNYAGDPREWRVASEDVRRQR